MARREQPREDLLAEATALAERIELALPDRPDHVVVGFRRDGAASVYFGEDPAYHFNSAGELRRAFLDGQLIKAEKGKLVALQRRRSDTTVALLSHECDASQAARICEECQHRLQELERRLVAEQFEIVGQIPSTADVLGRARAWATAIIAGFAIAQSPRVK